MAGDEADLKRGNIPCNFAKSMENKTVLITGADGFIGSHLTEMLVDHKAKVRALSYYNSFNNWGWLEEVDCQDKIEVLTGDVRDAHFCKDITRDADIIFNLAALIAVPYSYRAPDSYVETNIRGTLNICQAALENGCCERLIHTSTSEVYGTAKYVPIDEKHPFSPQSPYSASKIGADAIAVSFHHAFGLPVIIARPFNTYGPRQSARAVIPTIITQIAGGKKEIKLGDVTPTRDFTYVPDTCHGLIALAENEESVGQTVNIGSNREISIKDIAIMIKTLMNREVKLITEQERIRPGSSEVFRLRCDNGKLKRLTGFEPHYSLEEGLKETIQWFTRPSNLAKFKVDIYHV